MKKTLTVLLSILMIFALFGCQKAKEEEPEEVVEEVEETVTYHVQFTIDHNNGITKEIVIQSESLKLMEILEELKNKDVLKYEIKDGQITSLDLLDTKSNSRWVLYINDAVCEDVSSVEIKESDKIRFVYETEELTPVIDILGGWLINEDYDQKLSEEELKIFEDASLGMSGVGYVPIRIIATQASVGVNYAFLAQGTTISAVPEINYYIMVVYRDLDGSCEFKAINRLDIPDMQTREGSDSVFLKSWMVIRPADDAKFKNKTVQKSFEKVIKNYEGLDIYPLELLATQLVSGTNYLALCYGQTVTLDPIGDLYILEWYEDLTGKTSITRIENLNLQYYVAGE